MHPILGDISRLSHMRLQKGIVHSGLVPEGSMILAISDVHLKQLKTKRQKATYLRLRRLCEWAINNEMKIIFVGDTADIAAGYTPVEVKRAHLGLFEKLGAYNTRLDDRVIYCRGNHDFAFEYDWDSLPDYVDGNVLFKHGHRYFIFNYGLFGWLVGKPIVRVSEKLGIVHKSSGWEKWLLQHTYFSNKAIFKKGPKDAVEKSCGCIVTGHTHQPMLKVAKNGVIVANCGTVQNGDFIVITEKGIVLCSDNYSSS